MRSDSSTWPGNPELIRPATYLTSGEYATTSLSRARSSPVLLYLLQRSWSSIALTLVSRALPPLMARPADALGRRRTSAAATRPECIPGWSRSLRVQVVLEWCVGRPPLRANVWQTSGAARGDGH